MWERSRWVVAAAFALLGCGETPTTPGSSPPKKIRVDVERVRAQFPAYVSDVSQLYGCDSSDALEAARDKPCNELSVFDATFAE
jgi:hypothetical protein